MAGGNTAAGDHSIAQAVGGGIFARGCRDAINQGTRHFARVVLARLYVGWALCVGDGLFDSRGSGAGDYLGAHAHGAAVSALGLGIVKRSNYRFFDDADFFKPARAHDLLRVNGQLLMGNGGHWPFRFVVFSFRVLMNFDVVDPGWARKPACPPWAMLWNSYRIHKIHSGSMFEAIRQTIIR